jgi:hypothetical protein
LVLGWRERTLFTIAGEQVSRDGAGSDSFAEIYQKIQEKYNRYNLGGYFDLL